MLEEWINLGYEMRVIGHTLLVRNIVLSGVLSGLCGSSCTTSHYFMKSHLYSSELLVRSLRLRVARQQRSISLGLTRTQHVKARQFSTTRAPYNDKQERLAPEDAALGHRADAYSLRHCLVTGGRFLKHWHLRAEIRNTSVAFY